MLHLILAEAAVERVPEELWSHPAVSKQAKLRGKRPGDTLLDDTYHHAAMSKAAKRGRFDDMQRRGRPDILHTCLLVALESRLNKAGRLRVWVHTRNDEVITVRPDLRVQRAQHRFYGLLEQLLEYGEVPRGGGDNALMGVEPGTLPGLVSRIGAPNVVVLDESGDDVALPESMQAADGAATNAVVVIGAYPTGPFQSDVDAFAHTKVALGSEPLTAWAAIGEVVHSVPRA